MIKPPVSKPRPTKIGMRLNIRANPGRYEHVEVEYWEEYPIDAATDVPALRRLLAESARTEVRTALAAEIVPIPGLTGQGQNPAGHIAVSIYDEGIDPK